MNMCKNNNMCIIILSKILKKEIIKKDKWMNLAKYSYKWIFYQDWRRLRIKCQKYKEEYIII